jgi:hypothetical protein
VTFRANLSAQGEQANSSTREPAMSFDGMTMAFMSFAANLVPGDMNSEGDIFAVHWQP